MATTIIQQQSHGIMDFSRFENAWKACEFIAASSFCPKEFRSKPGDVLCAIQYGAEIGLQPMQALQNVAVINGRPCVYGDTLLALCQSSPECDYIHEEYDEETETAICRVKRKGHPEIVRKFSEKDAEAAGLLKREGPWRTYKKRMQQMRARGFALRDAFAFLLRGIITLEEARDYPEPQKQFQKITPISPNVQILEQSSMLEETRHRLFSLVDAVKLSDERVQKLKKSAQVNSLEGLSEKQALNVIAKLEKELADAMKQEEHQKVLMVRNGCEKCNNKPLGDYFCKCEMKAGMEPGDESCYLSVDDVAVNKEEGEKHAD